MKLLKKRAFLLFLILIFSLFSTTLYTFAASKETESGLSDLYAKSAVLMDADSGRILFEKNGHSVLPMASTTKIMTCILALEYGNRNDYAVTSSYAAGMPKVKLYAKQNDCFLLGDLLYSLMLESHNDSAVIIAEHIAGSTEAFADMMNQKARDIGCFDTYFITPNGLDATVTGPDGVSRTHSTTAADLAKIMSYCITYSPQRDAFLKITGTASYSFEGYHEKDGLYVSNGKTYHCNNHNTFLSMMSGAFSGKTGFTGNAGYCYVGALKNDHCTFVVALLACGWPNNKSYKWSDTKQLMNYGLENYEYHTSEEFTYDISQIEPIPVLGGQTHTIGETAYTKIETKKSQEELSHDRLDSLFDKDNTHGFLLKTDEEIHINCEMSQTLTAPVHVGDLIGTVKYLINDEIYQIDYIVASQDVPAIDLNWCINQILCHFFL